MKKEKQREGMNEWVKKVQPKRETTNNKQTIDNNTMAFRDLVVDVVRAFCHFFVPLRLDEWMNEWMNVSGSIVD